jgi:hypothetical protein
VDSHNFDASGAALSALVQNVHLEDQQARAGQDAFEQQLDAARMADTAHFTGAPTVNRRPMCLVEIAITFGP